MFERNGRNDQNESNKTSNTTYHTGWNKQKVESWGNIIDVCSTIISYLRRELFKKDIFDNLVFALADISVLRTTVARECPRPPTTGIETKPPYFAMRTSQCSVCKEMFISFFIRFLFLFQLADRLLVICPTLWLLKEKSWDSLVQLLNISARKEVIYQQGLLVGMSN